jgi:hypothetical protein
MVALATGNRMVRISGDPSGFLRVVPSASTTRTWAPSQLAWREPEAKSQRPLARNRLHLVADRAPGEDAGRRVENLVGDVGVEIGRRHGANAALAEAPGGGGVGLRHLLLHLHEHFQRRLSAAQALWQQRAIKPIVDQRGNHGLGEPPRALDLVGLARNERN